MMMPYLQAQRGSKRLALNKALPGDMASQDNPYTPAKRPPPLQVATADAERTTASPASRIPRQRSYTSTASLENDREGDYETTSLGPDRGAGAFTAREPGRYHAAPSSRLEESILTPDTVVQQSPADTMFSVDTIKMASLDLRGEDTEGQAGDGDSTPRRMDSTASQPHKSSGPSTNVGRSRTLPRMRRSSNQASGANSQEDEDALDTPTRPRRSSLKRDPSSSSLLDPMNGCLGATSGLRKHSFRKTSRFVDPDVAAKMKRWVQEIVVCNFDLDRGPIVERRMAGRPWAKGEKANV